MSDDEKRPGEDAEPTAAEGLPETIDWDNTSDEYWLRFADHPWYRGRVDRLVRGVNNPAYTRVEAIKDILDS